ncbi:phosphate ABC transporter substrate-binding protein, PhoT family [Bacillus sp. OV322]|uniref:phosphate ABC transporter substrate-binding protein PstS family protein n=1 Tax=Bacillus sp. OV322 TaxID=1882764 RepID=UPI0008ED587A|nr:phosphate ABC transporter substrate-binding protein PstS family protein [Bacillus sp. OV322]SFC30690.1 phosphate ABC transporter substrate-binding protein, PhoT family [Bacillus sp. OV322]
MKITGLKLSMAALVMAGALAGCGKADDSKGSDNAKKADDNKTAYSGTVTAAGSTALQPLAEEAANEIQGTYPDLSVTVQGGGSGTGVNQVAAGAVNIGNSDVPSADKLEDKSKADKLVDTKVAGIGFALVVNKDVSVETLKENQIQGIFSGKIKNWKEVGGKDEKINVINRPASSGTRATFEKTMMAGVKIDDSIGTAQDSNGAVEQSVNSTKGSISYLALSYLVGDKKDSLKTLKINDVEPTSDNIVNKKYPFWSYEYMITDGHPKDGIKGFIDYVTGDKFADKVTEMGYIPMSDLK